MTLSLLSEIGIESVWEQNKITVKAKKTIENKLITVESDWSSASYYYSLVALSKGATLTLSSYKKASLQGDAVLAEIYKSFGVKTTFNKNLITLTKVESRLQHQNISFDLSNAPDIAQTIAVTCFGLGLACHLKGLHTLKIKETDRLVALKTELEKFGAEILITDESLTLKAASIIKKNIKVDTYNDHRMAMAFAPLLLKTDLEIEEAEVVSKSYPNFWLDIQKLTK